MELIVYQVVGVKLTEQYARMLLGVNKITKEEKLLGLILAELGGDGMVEIINGSRDNLCAKVGISKEIYAAYLFKWKKMGLITKSGDWITFSEYIQPDTKYIAVTCNTNGMVVKSSKQTNGME